MEREKLGNYSFRKIKRTPIQIKGVYKLSFYTHPFAPNICRMAVLDEYYSMQPNAILVMWYSLYLLVRIRNIFFINRIMH